MVDSPNSRAVSNEPQCQHFVVRKKRLCRMTVRPGRQYCGEHEPQPRTENGKTDERVPCPNDPKHTCYISKLEKHLAICNARQGELPPYVVPHINAPAAVETFPRKPLSEVSRESLMLLIDKVNCLYDEHIKGNISTVPERPIHPAVLTEFNESDRTESSLRHLRQASRLLWLAQDEGLVADGTCYVELGAGKGQMSYYMGQAWCAEGTGSRVLVVDRAALRHKRDNLVRGRSLRLRADLAHLALHLAPGVPACRKLLHLAKHLCGVATDYALRCLSGAGVVGRCRGAVLATCCHHRCQRALYVAAPQLQELGINDEEFNTMLGVVSWATCGDGRSRDTRRQREHAQTHALHSNDDTSAEGATTNGVDISDSKDHPKDIGSDQNASLNDTVKDKPVYKEQVLTQEERQQVGRKAKALLDWGRVLFLRGEGFDARLCYYVPSSVSLENVCIVAKKAVTDP